MPQWEYRTVVRRRRFRQGIFEQRAEAWDIGVEEILGPAGREGWELAAVVPDSKTAKGASASGSADEEL